MERLIALLAVIFAGSAIVSTAKAQSPDAPCTDEATCAKPFWENGLYGVRDRSGLVTIPPTFSMAQKAAQRYPNSDAKSLIITQKDGKFGFVSGDGAETEAPHFSSVSSAAHGYFIVKRDGKSCLIDRHGRRLLDCRFDLILVSESPDIFFVKENGATHYMNLSGAKLVYSQPEPARPSPPVTPAVTTPAAPPPSRLEQLVRARMWDEAVRLAAANGTPQEIRDVLLNFSRSASNTDARYNAGRQAIYENIEMVEKGKRASLPMVISELQRLETGILTWAEGPILPPSGFRGNINARTVGECLSAGGRVTVMQTCAR